MRKRLEAAQAAAAAAEAQEKEKALAQSEGSQKLSGSQETLSLTTLGQQQQEQQRLQSGKSVNISQPLSVDPTTNRQPTAQFIRGGPQSYGPPKPKNTGIHLLNINLLYNSS